MFDAFTLENATNDTSMCLFIIKTSDLVLLNYGFVAVVSAFTLNYPTNKTKNTFHAQLCGN